MNGNDEDEERRRQALENQALPLDDLIYGPKRKTATGQEDLRHEARENRVKPVPLRMQLRVNVILRAAMKKAGYKSFPKFFELMLAVYLESHPLDDALIPSEEELIRRFLNQRDEDDGR